MSGEVVQCSVAAGGFDAGVLHGCGIDTVYDECWRSTVYANWAAKGYRLPTEAEWEKAARGGLSGQRFPGAISSLKVRPTTTDAYLAAALAYDLGPNGYNAAFDTGGYPYTSPVGYFAPNGYGLYDMAGNVWEWCWDWYGTPYAGGTDPRGPASFFDRVSRGGDWDCLANWCRTANRTMNVPWLSVITIGFRSVLPSGQ